MARYLGKEWNPKINVQFMHGIGSKVRSILPGSYPVAIHWTSIRMNDNGIDTIDDKINIDRLF